MGMGGSLAREETELDLAGHGDVFFELGFLAANGLVEARVFDGDGNLAGEGGEDALVLVVEGVGAGVFEIENADDAALVEEWHDEFGACLGIHFEIAWVFGDVGDVDETPLADGGADEAGRDGKAAERRVGVAEAPCIARDEGFALFVEEHDGEHLVVDEAAEELTDALEERAEIEDGGELDSDFVEDFEGLGLTGDAGVEAGVFDGLGDARSSEGE